MRIALALVFMTSSFAFADVVLDWPDPECEPGYVVVTGHHPPQCHRPSCQTDSDCPSGLGLVCPPGRCFRYVEDRECLEREGLGRREHHFGARNAFEPPPPCPPLQVDEGPESCLSASDCGPGLNCTPRTCQPGPGSEMQTSMSAMSEMSAMSAMSAMSTESGMHAGNDTTEEDGCSVGGRPSWLALCLFFLIRRRV